MTPGLGIEPEPHWWKASALTTAPSLLPSCVFYTRWNPKFMTTLFSQGSAYLRKYNTQGKSDEETSEDLWKKTVLQTVF